MKHNRYSAANSTHHATNGNAIVIGGGMAGLLAARVLSDHFASVTILERDTVPDAPEVRKGQPHACHLHGPQAQGLQMMVHYFPDLLEGLQQNGAVVADMDAGMRWLTDGDNRLQAQIGLQGALLSRAMLEWQIRRRLLAIGNVRMVDQCDVQGLQYDEDGVRIIGVRASLRLADGRARVHRADLVIDTRGRSVAPRAGCRKPSMATRWASDRCRIHYRGAEGGAEGGAEMAEERMRLHALLRDLCASLCAPVVKIFS